MKNIFVLTLFLTILSCKERSISENSVLSHNKVEVFKNNDLTAYIKLTNYYDTDDNYFEILPHSLKIMDSDKVGYEDFFETYLKIKFNDTLNYNYIEKLDKEEQNFLIYLLNKGAVNNSYRCRKILADYYRKGISVKMNTIKADSLMSVE
ncbi:hypothetical protein P3875_01175 [Myroides sp. JBRI-B21084]|uniref:hypothetical protein n=1 Tax=Myroides sp. JBRI-B21084 TaxID=3119977 RepID=UPI0026E2B1F4|nr:hypothetical protein [Paenimyroides cloacae]WKW46713.1 hypothetical protein P3875_01175 [Paenimyroides cloacae]